MKTIYRCEICGTEYEKKAEARKHEAHHFGLSLDQYERWGHLARDVESMERVLSDGRHGQALIQAYQEAVKTLKQYEESHSLRGRKPLTDCLKKEGEI